MSDLFIFGLMAHLVADWFLQNEYMALNKTSLAHPASWLHSGIHLVAYLFVFSPLVAVLLAVSHILIDTRVPLIWWRRFYKQTQEGPVMVPFAMWQDQAVHLLCLGFTAWMVSR